MNLSLNFKRLMACIVDWYLCSVMISAFKVLVEDIVVDQYMESYLIVFFAILSTIIYYVLIQKKLNGQTLGKKLFSIKVVKRNGEDISFGNIVKRELIGVLIVEGSTMAASNYLRELLQMATDLNILVPLSIASSVITIASIFYAQINKEHLMFHDIIGNTKVVYIPKI